MRRYFRLPLHLIMAVISALVSLALSLPLFAETDFVVRPGRAAYPMVTAVGPDHNRWFAENASQSRTPTQIVNAGSGNGTLSGMYAGTFSGYDQGNWFVAAVSLTADGNGNITGGETDSNNSSSGVKHATITSGNYSIGSNGLGQLNWTDSSGGNAQLLITVVSGGDVRIIGNNTQGSQGTWGDGVLRQQNPSAFNLAALAGNWALGMQGFDSSVNPFAAAASYQETANGNITGVIDVNDFGQYAGDAAFTESPTSGIDANGRVTTQLQMAGSQPITFAYYIISANELVGIDTVSTASGGGLVVVDVLRQSGTMNDGILNGNAVDRESRQQNNNGSSVSDAQVGLVVFDGQGNMTVSSDENKGGIVTVQRNIVFTYSVFSNGRTTLLESGLPTTVCYVVQQNEGFCIESNAQSPGGIFFEPQAAGVGNNAALSGMYQGGSLPQYVSTNFDQVDSNLLDGIGSYQSTFTESGPNGTNQNQTLNGTYAIDTTGGITISQNGTPVYYGYLVSPNKYDLISGDSNPRVLVEAQPITTFTLMVTISGSGTVTSTDGFINCPGMCSSSYPINTPVTLNATPAAGQTFAGWSGACTGTGACNVIMTQNLSVTATFTQINYLLTVSTNGSGTVTSTDGDITCPGTCGNSYPSNTPVTLNAAPATGWSFAGWSGACSGTGACNVVMTQDLSVTATFTQTQGFYSLTVSTNGAGTETSTDGFINCPGICSHTYPANAPVTLNATPGQGGTFTGWSGACSGTGPCNLTMTQNLALAATFSGQQDMVMHNFGSGSDGQNPVANLISDSANNLYGTTSVGGTYAKGTAFELSPEGTETILHNFGNGNDGQNPLGSLIFDSAGNLYGTTSAGGMFGSGTVFELTPNGTETVLYSFGSAGDGQNPNAGVVFDSSGNLYGTTLNGGAYGGGTAFELSPNGAGGWTETGLYSFGNGSDGRNPYAGLVLDGSGNLYGTTANGGVNGGGTAFELSSNAAPSRCCREVMTYSFGGSGDGLNPHAGLVFDSSGNLYGTTVMGGAFSGGTAFELSPTGGGSWTESVVYSFGNGSADGLNPYAGLVFDSSGSNLYGTTANGGLYTRGTVFELVPNAAPSRCCREIQVYNFGIGLDGRNPQAGVVLNATGNLYGTTMNGGVNGGGTVFGIMPSQVQFVPATPCRVVDTRNSDGTFGGPPMGGGTMCSFPLAQSGNPCNIPSNAIAYSLNVTVVPQHDLGYLTIWPTGQAQPLVSTLNSPDGRIKANAAIVPAGTPMGAVSVYVTDTTNVILDIDGYFTASGPSTLMFYPLTPCRLVDTRGANGPLGGPRLPAQQERDFPLLMATSCIPPGTNPSAYSLNFTAVPNPAGQALGYLSVWPAGDMQPLVSTLNNPTGTVVANAAIVPAGQGGEVAVWAFNTTDLLIDINGYFAAPGSGGYSFYPVTPCRAYDSRNNNGQPFTGERTVNIVGSTCAPPNTAAGYVFNATVVPSGSLGYLTLWPDPEQQPVVSTLNAYDGFITSNMAIVPNMDGLTDAYGQGYTQLILDISGYFAP